MAPARPLLVLSLLVLAAACKPDAAPTAPGPSQPVASSPEPEASTSPAETSAPPVASADASPCESLAARWHGCIDVSTPADLQADEHAAVDATFRHWGSGADTPSDRRRLTSECTAALEALDDECRPLDLANVPPLSFQPVGVPQCDEYVRAFAECVHEKLPEQMRETSMEALGTSLDAWRKAARTPAGRDELARSCQTATEAVAGACGWDGPEG